MYHFLFGSLYYLLAQSAYSQITAHIIIIGCWRSLHILHGRVCLFLPDMTDSS